VTTDQIMTTIESLMRGVFNQPTLRVNQESSALNVDGWTSLNHINLIIAVEQKFGITFDLGEVDELKNVGEFVSLVKEKLN
jgi:acyl carrier protein